MARTSGSTSVENPKPRKKRQRLEKGEQSREETSDRIGKRREEGGGGEEGIFVVDSDNDVRSGADDVLLSKELQKLERREQSREETSDRKGKRKEEGGDKGIFVVDSDSDVRSGADDVLLSKELQKLERREQFREETSDRKGKRKEEGGDEGIFVIDSADEEGIFVVDSDSDVRSGSDDVLLSKELQKLEKREQSREETSDRKGKRKEEGGDEGIVVIDSADDVLLSEEIQIQEILFMTMKSEKERENLPLVTEEEQGSDISKPDPTDRKGKQPAKSCNRVNHAKFLCEICMEQVPTIHSFHINPCNHIFCNSCIVNYITSKLDGSNATIPCPHPGCKYGFLDPLTCQHILPVDTFDKWGLVLCESSLGRNKFYCPFKDCSALLVDDEGGEEVRNCECPHCHRMFCAKCKVPWHGDMSCKEFQSLGKDERGQEDLMLRNLAKDKRWQRCPQCRMYVEKIDGCMFMKCRCGYCFCYVCATPMSKETHYCPTCKR